jgi:hypothetical protein
VFVIVNYQGHTSFIWINILFDDAFNHGDSAKFWGYDGRDSEKRCLELYNLVQVIISLWSCGSVLSRRLCCTYPCIKTFDRQILPIGLTSSLCVWGLKAGPLVWWLRAERKKGILQLLLSGRLLHTSLYKPHPLKACDYKWLCIRLQWMRELRRVLSSTAQTRELRIQIQLKVWTDVSRLVQCVIYIFIYLFYLFIYCIMAIFCSSDYIRSNERMIKWMINWRIV